MIPNFLPPFIEAPIFAYLIGSFPSAYIVMKIFKNTDITKTGSGNIGTMNAYEVSGSWGIGVLVLIMDLLKGFLALYIATERYYDIDKYQFIVGIFVVVGHNWNIFLKFKGGRGLAPAAGVMLGLNWIGLLLWLLMYFISKKVVSSNVHIANLSACIIAPVLFFYSPNYIIIYTDFFQIFDLYWMKIVYLILNLLIIFKHIPEIIKLIKNYKNSISE